MFKNLRDYLWVLQAFLRGKVLRQKAYTPQDNCFRLPVSMTTNRILMLMKWWGLRPLTQKEGEALILQAADRNDDVRPGGSWDNHFNFGRYLDRKDEWYAEKDQSDRWSLLRR